MSAIGRAVAAVENGVENADARLHSARTGIRRQSEGLLQRQPVLDQWIVCSPKDTQSHCCLFDWFPHPFAFSVTPWLSVLFLPWRRHLSMRLSIVTSQQPRVIDLPRAAAVRRRVPRITISRPSYPFVPRILVETRDDVSRTLSVFSGKTKRDTTPKESIDSSVEL